MQQSDYPCRPRRTTFRRRAQTARSLRQLGVLIWGKQGDSLAPEDRIAYASDAQIELRGILRAMYRNPGCNPNRQIASAYLAIQRTDPAIRFTQSAQSIGRKLTALPPGGLQDEDQSTATPAP